MVKQAGVNTPLIATLASSKRSFWLVQRRGILLLFGEGALDKRRGWGSKIPLLRGAQGCVYICLI